jgi:hypothetical protein
LALDSALPSAKQNRTKAHRGNQGVAIGGFACAFAILGIFTLGVLFIPIAALLTLSSFSQSLRGDGSGLLISVVGAILTGIGFATSPLLWLAVASLFTPQQDDKYPASISPNSSIASVQAPASPKPFEGLWVREKSECFDEDGRTRTLIQFDNRIDGKLVPLFDQYENHCVIGDWKGSSNSTELSATCFEFWEDFTRRTGGKKTTIKLSQVAGGITIDGDAYYRCE